jgi:DNA-binding CsgD family transcriptional regulator
MRYRNLCINDLLVKRCETIRTEKKQNCCISIYNIAGILSVLITPDGSIVDLDRSVCDRTGFIEDDLLNKDVYETLFRLEEGEKRNLKLLISESDRFRFRLWINLKCGGQIEYIGLFEKYLFHDDTFFLCFLVPEYKPEIDKPYLKLISHLEGSIKYLKKKVELLEEERDYICRYTSNKFESSVRPFIDELKRINKNKKTDLYLKIIEDSLVESIYRYHSSESYEIRKLTANENTILQFIKQGKSSKEIAEILNITLSTVSYHRHNIRKKIGLNKKRMSLSNYVKTHSAIKPKN